jgi:hypothetical protein
MPAVDDIHNQGVLRLIQEEDAMNRTIGVITKCDMLQRRDEHKVRIWYPKNASILSLIRNFTDIGTSYEPQAGIQT